MLANIVSSHIQPNTKYIGMELAESIRGSSEIIVGTDEKIFEFYGVSMDFEFKGIGYQGKWSSE